MEKTNVLKLIGGQRAVVGIVAVGSNERIFQCGDGAGGHHYRGMLEGTVPGERELNDVSGPEILQGGTFPTGPTEKVLRVRKFHRNGTPVQAGAFWLAVM